MVYSISDKVIDKFVEPDGRSPEMDARFQRVKDHDEGEPKHNGGPLFLDEGEKWRIWRNVLAIGFAFMIHFTAFWGASNLQSSINADEALGTFTLAAIYGSLILSNIFLPAVVIKWFGCKWTTSLSFITYMPFILAQFYPKFYTMIPAGLAVGFGGGPLWCAKCTYLTVIAEAYAQITGVASEIVVTKFFGVFFMFYQFSQVWGNLISSAVLSNGPSDMLDIIDQNVTEAFQTAGKSNYTVLCGANFEPDLVVADVNPNLSKPPASKIQIIAGIYLACMILACLIVAFFVDPLKRYNKARESSAKGLSGCRLLAVTLKHLINPHQLLILPITMFIGAEQAFLAADFNAAFVSCGWGISNIGFVMICFGVCNAISALGTGSIVKLTGRKSVMIFALILHIILMITLQKWQPTQDNKYIYFIVAGLWGLCDAIWLVQVNSFYGILFPGREEAAYSNFRLWEATGSVITYAYSPYLRTASKVYVLIGLLCVGFSGYIAVEILSKREMTENDFELVASVEDKKRFSREVAQ